MNENCKNAVPPVLSKQKPCKGKNRIDEGFACVSDAAEARGRPGLAQNELEHANEVLSPVNLPQSIDWNSSLKRMSKLSGK